MTMKFTTGQALPGGTGEFTPLTAGTHGARIVQVIDAGVHIQEYKGEAKPPATQLVFTFEVQEGDQTKLISRQVPLSDHTKSGLQSIVSAATGKNFTLAGGLDVETVLNAEVLITVGTTVNGNPKVTGITPLPRGMTIPAATTELLTFDCDTPDEVVKGKLFQWVQTLIDTAGTTSEASTGTPGTEPDSSDF